MSRRVLNNAEILKFLHKAKPQYRRAILKQADKALIHCICECTHNTLRGKLPLTNQQKSKLGRHKKLLRRIVKRGEPLSVKKKIIVQKGGALLPLLLAPLITGVIGSFFK